MISGLSIVFFGTPYFAAQILESLIQNHVHIKAIVTQPDRPKGRSLQVAPSAVKEVAQANLPDIPIFQPEKCSNPEFLQQLAMLQADLYVVVAFGQILPQKLLQIPGYGCINVHASLLPKYRGAAPIHRALLNGEIETGIAIQKMVKELDAGDVIAEEKIKIPEEMTFGELERALCDLSKPLLLAVLQLYTKGIPPAAPQDVSQVTYAAKVNPEEAKIDWSRDARTIHNLIRAMNPRPGAWCFVEWNGEVKRLKILRSRPVSKNGIPGQILDGSTIACGLGALQLLEVQPEGKQKMAAQDWLRGAKSIQFQI